MEHEQSVRESMEPSGAGSAGEAWNVSGAGKRGRRAGSVSRAGSVNREAERASCGERERSRYFY